MTLTGVLNANSIGFKKLHLFWSVKLVEIQRRGNDFMLSKCCFTEYIFPCSATSTDSNANADILWHKLRFFSFWQKILTPSQCLLSLNNWIIKSWFIHVSAEHLEIVMIKNYAISSFNFQLCLLCVLVFLVNDFLSNISVWRWKQRCASMGTPNG